MLTGPGSCHGRLIALGLWPLRDSGAHHEVNPMGQSLPKAVQFCLVMFSGFLSSFMYGCVFCLPVLINLVYVQGDFVRPPSG